MHTQTLPTGRNGPHILDSVLLRTAIVILLLAGIWLPLLLNNYVSPDRIDGHIIEDLRVRPSDTVLSEIGRYNYGLGSTSITEPVRSAERALSGRLDLSGITGREIQIPFSASDALDGPTDWQLYYSGFLLPRLYLAAYEAGGQDRFIIAARDFILAWADFEASLWLPKGLVWNDHAVVARAITLARFWGLYRRHHAYNTRDAQRILELLSITAKRLVSPSQYTYATNHGVMQNLALLHLACALPSLPGVDDSVDKALARLDRQMGFYINDEGVVLEHSPGYHRYGVELLGMALRYLTLLRRPIPLDWKRKYTAALAVYAELRRPSGTLPIWGDTAAVEEPHGPLVTWATTDETYAPLSYRNEWRPAKPAGLYPAAGHLLFWVGLEEWPRSPPLSQTAMTWSNYPEHGHKHADDLSMVLWAWGRNWWRNTGYWPYTLSGRKAAVGWDGSNAPHLVGESAASERITALLGTVDDELLKLVDVARNGPKELSIRRQVVHLVPDLWLVLDSYTGAGENALRTVWTTGTGLSARGGNGLFQLFARDRSSGKMVVKVSGDPAPAVILASGDTVLGHGEYGGRVVRLPAIIVEQKVGTGWILISSDLAASASGTPRMERWFGPTNWEVALPTRRARIVRQGRTLYYKASTNHELVIGRPDPAVDERIEAVRRAFQHARAMDGGKFRNLLPYRLKASYLILGLFVLQELILFIYCSGWGTHTRTLSRLSLGLWIVLGIWLLGFYF